MNTKDTKDTKKGFLNDKGIVMGVLRQYEMNPFVSFMSFVFFVPFVFMSVCRRS